MARFTPVQIYGFARQAGFSPDQAATMTAIALAESGGVSGARNQGGEDSRGLWQINARAHPDLAAKYDLYDPLQNARAAYQVSRSGEDISQWTVTHRGAAARYLSHRTAAQDAAVAHGEGRDRGVWTGTSGYGHPVSAGTGGASAAAPEAVPVQAAAVAADAPTTSAAGPASDSALHRFLEEAKAQTGDRYVFGAEAKLSDADPETFDCSELVQWAAHQAGVEVPDGASAQYLWAKERGLIIPVEQAVQTPGALLFNFSTEPRPGGGRPSTAHVAISLGDGQTIEARNSRYPVGSFDVGSRFTYAAVIPGISDPESIAAAAGAPQPAVVPEPTAPAVTDGAPLAVPPQPAAPEYGGADTDGDGLVDLKEQAEGLDALRADTDDDTLPDGWEVAHGSDPRLADSDGDLLADAFEFAQGLDPMDPDTDDDGHLDGSLPESWLDTDRDGIDDGLERLLQIDPLLVDTDSDGFVDGLEYTSGSNPADPFSTPVTATADALADDSLG